MLLASAILMWSLIPVQAEAGRERVAAARQAIVGTSLPDAGIQFGDGSSAWTVTAFYYRGRDRWVARQVRGNSGPTSEVVWAESGDCHQILGVLEWMSRLPATQFSPEGRNRPLALEARVQPIPPPPNPEEGLAEFAVWGPVRDFSGQRYTMEIRGGTPAISTFGRSSITALEACWESSLDP